MSVIAKIVPKPKGAYSSSATYNTLDIVRYDNKTWMCRQDSVTNVTPTEGSYWMLIVEDGESSGGGDASKNLIRDTVGFVNQSLIDSLNFSPATVSNIHFQPESDKTVTLSGTANGRAEMVIANVTLDSGYYYLSLQVTESTTGNVSSSNVYATVGDTRADLYQTIQFHVNTSGTYDVTLNVENYTNLSSGIFNFYVAVLEDKTVDGLISDIDSKVSIINGKIPANASTSNKLATMEDIGSVDYNGIEALIKTTVGWATKNILNCDIASGEHTKNGLTIYVTRQANGQISSISVNGTATAKTYIEVASSVPQIAANAYILNGCPSGGSSSSYGLKIEGDFGSEFTDYGNGVLIQRGVVNGKVYIVIANGYTADHLYFYPMIRDKNIEDDTYEGYCENVKNKLETVQESACTDIVSGATVNTGEQGNHVYKYGKVVVLKLTLGNVTANAWTSICNIPEGFRPKSQIRPVAFVDGIDGVAIAKIEPNGNIQSSKYIANTFSITATWITS